MLNLFDLAVIFDSSIHFATRAARLHDGP